MQYILCPRCQFRVALNRHLCGTCGLEMPSLKQLQSNAKNCAHESQVKKSKFWNTLLGLSSSKPVPSGAEHGHEEPALTS